MNRQHARQNHAGDVKVAMVEINRLFIGCRCLNRDMALNMRVALCGILKHGEVGEDQRVCTQLRCHINGTLPACVTIRVRKGVNRNVQLTAMLMNETHRFLQFFLGKIKAGEMTGVGIIFQPDVDSISAVLDGRLKRREVSGRAEQLHNLS